MERDLIPDRCSWINGGIRDERLAVTGMGMSYDVEAGRAFLVVGMRSHELGQCCARLGF